MKMCYRRLIVGPAPTETNLIQMSLDRAERRLRLSVSKNSLAEFVAMLEEIADDQGDQTFEVEIKGKSAMIFYWPCFGHIYKTGEPQNRFPE